MPVPVYLICSESGAVDENTKLTSLFNIVEKLQIAKLQPAPGQMALARATPLRISAFWMKEHNDFPETLFEVQFVAIFPNGPPEIEIARGQFRFAGPFQRLNVIGLQLNQFFGPGMLQIEAKIRKVGEEVWLSRVSYPIILEEVPPLGIHLPAAPVQPPAPTD